MENIILIIILGVALCISIAFSFKLYNKIETLEKERDDVKKQKENSERELQKLKKDKLDELNSIDYTGRKGVYIVPNLSWKEGENAKKLFTVTYEVEILEFTNTKFKIKANSFTVNEAFAADPKHKNSILEYINGMNNWVNRSDVQLIMDDTTKRDIKLEKLLGKG